jgi:hypothetical protein
MQKKIGRWIVPSAWIVLSVARSAHAYIDPGTGSYVLQTLLAIVLAGLYAMKIYWRHIIGFFRGSFGRQRPDEELEK